MPRPSALVFLVLAVLLLAGCAQEATQRSGGGARDPSRHWRERRGRPTDGDVRTYRIPVTPLMGDSPYATQSQWAFAPYSSGPPRDEVHAASYTLTARVLRTT